MWSTDFERRLPADSGGTVWDLHPLPSAAGRVVVCGEYSVRFGTDRLNVGAPGYGAPSHTFMSKTSTATVRARPVPDVTTASGAFRVDAETFTIESAHRIEVIDLTDRVMAMVRQRPIREGLASLCSLHTTCTVFINEFQKALLADMRAFLEQAVAADGQWLHNDPNHSDCDRMNAAAHLRAMLLGHSLTVQVGHGEIVLGQWQRILVAELDGPRTRSLRLTVMGVE